MSLIAATSANFQSILDAALDSYVKQTGVDITKHPSAEKLQNCHSPEDVIQLLSEGETAFKDYRVKYQNLINHFSSGSQNRLCVFRHTRRSIPADESDISRH